MIICMDIGTNGRRYVAHIEYNSGLTNGQIVTRAQGLVDCYDEIYVMQFDNNSKSFINDIVLRGCRV